MTRISAIDRLRALPATITGSVLALSFNWSSKTTSQYLYLWSQKGYIAPLGGRSDIYANLLVNPNPNWEAILSSEKSSALVIGTEALRRAGWSTQIPARPEVAVLYSEKPFDSPHFSIEARGSTWFQKVSSGVLRNQGTLPCLAPEWALADLLWAHSGWGGFGLDPDDIDLDEADESALTVAFTAFKLDHHLLLSSDRAASFKRIIPTPGN
jgi:hypothetical protein